MKIETGLKIMLGAGISVGIIALIMGITGDWGAFFGTLVVSLGFIGLSWAGKRILSADESGKPRPPINLVIGVIFGGAGLIMLIGSIALFVDDDFQGAIAMLIFGLVFCGAGYMGSRVFAIPEGMKSILMGQGTKAIDGVLGQSGELTGGTYIYVDEKTTDTEIAGMQKDWSAKPWTQRKDWAEGKVIQDGTFDMRLLTAFTVIWNIIGWGIASFGILSAEDSAETPWFLLIFPAVGIGLMIMTVRTWIRKRKFGISILHCATMPFYLGERLQGIIQTGLPIKNRPTKEFFIQLNCVRRTTVIDQDRDERVSEKTLWSQKQTAFGSLSAAGATFQVSVNMDIPADLPPGELYPEDDRILWRLHITSSVKGVDYAASFEVPIYQRMEAAMENRVRSI